MGIRIGKAVGDGFNSFLSGLGVGVGQGVSGALNRVADRAGDTGGKTASRNLLPWVVGGFAALLAVTFFVGRKG